MGCKRTVRIVDEDGKFVRWISLAERDEKIASLIEYCEDRPNGVKHFIGYVEKSFNPTSARNDKSTLTMSDTLANIGISSRPRGQVSPSRQSAVQRKIVEWGMTHKTFGLTDQQREAVSKQIARGATPSQAAKRLGLTKEYVDAFVNQAKARIVPLEECQSYAG